MDLEDDTVDIYDDNFDDDIIIYRYEVGVIINENRSTICATNDLEQANEFYEKTIKKYSPGHTTDRVIVFLFDYSIGVNKNYYDSIDDVC